MPAGSASGMSTPPIVRLGSVTLSRSDFSAAAGPYVIRGDTFALQDVLQATGCRWSADERAWLADVAAADRLLAWWRARAAPAGKYAAGDEGDAAAGYGLAEEPCVTGWTSLGMPGDPRARRMNRLSRLPPDLWADEEVLEILLGQAFPDLGPDLATWLLERFGGFGPVLAADPSRYAEHPTLAARGGGPVAVSERCSRLAMLLKAVAQVVQRSLREEIQDRPVIGSWTALLDYLRLAMQHDTAEQFRILFLDRKNILIRDEVQSKGTVDHTPLYPREVVKRALELAASAIIMVHNHPSGDPTPSQADIEMTRQVTAALSQVNITVHDHIVIGKNRHTSFKTQKLI
jgi:DNA repair protein RadC